MNWKGFFRHWRIILLIFMVVVSIYAISPRFSVEGVTIRSVEYNSPLVSAGLEPPRPDSKPTSRERVLSINNMQVNSVEDFHRIESEIIEGTAVLVKTSKNTYVVDNVTSLGITVYEPPTTNIRKGLDLEGGTRVVLQPQEEVSREDLNLILMSINQRLNIYGLSDVTVRTSTDLAGNTFIIVEIAGMNVQQVTDLVTSQGKFEAKIVNDTVFKGGTDITQVCRIPQCSGLDTQKGCNQISETEFACGFYFQILLSPEAAQRQAEVTSKLSSDGQYLSEKLDFYLDDELVNSLSISSNLKGRAETTIVISGSGIGASMQSAKDAAFNDMKQMQSVLISGRLPVQLDVVQATPISSVLGKEFLSNSLKVGLFALLAITLVVFLRYRNLKISIPMLVTMIFELIILFGVAAMIGWNIDLAAIAGIIIAIGTSLDHAIIITDETVFKNKEVISWKEKLKRAFFIIFGSYFTVLVAMIPLMFAGAGLLRGFAFTTILGFTIGVLITRPAYGVMIEFLFGDKS